jgi:hypothetical protein
MGDFPDLPPASQPPSSPIRTEPSGPAPVGPDSPGTGPSAPSPSGPGSARTGYGLLWLDVDSDKADIALDGAYLDQDVWLISIPPGAHEIRIRKQGFKAYESRFGIAPGQNLHLDVHLEAAGDSLARRPN